MKSLSEMNYDYYLNITSTCLHFLPQSSRCTPAARPLLEKLESGEITKVKAPKII